MKSHEDFTYGTVQFPGATYSVALIVPLPLAQWPPAFSVTVLAAALQQRDGILLLVGLIAAAVSLTTFIAAVGGALLLVEGALASAPSGRLGEARPFGHARSSLEILAP